MAFFVIDETLPEALIVDGDAVVPSKFTHALAEYDGAEPDAVESAVAVAELPEHEVEDPEIFID